MCVAKTACFLDEELYNYLRRNDSVMGKVYNRKNKGIYDSLYSLEHFYDFLRRNSLEKRYNRLFVDIYQNCWRFCGLTGCRLIDIRLVLFSKLTLFNLSLKNAVVRLKFCGLRILRLRQRK
jgi:hypothetical protein